MTFRPHINQIISRAKCVLGLVKRMSKNFSCPYVTKSLYTSLVRPILEYATVAWSPFLACDITRIESVQKQFLLFALRDLGWAPGFQLPSYEARLALIDLNTLADIRLVATCLFTASCIKGSISASYLRQCFTFNHPVRTTRSSSVRRLQNLPTPTSQYAANSPLRRSVNAFNTFAHLFSPLHGVSVFKDRIYRHLQEQRRVTS